MKESIIRPRRSLRLGVLSRVLSIVLTFAATPLFAATFSANSLIIPMDTTYQNYGMFKAYGLVYKLLQNGIPVSWAIGNPKTPDTFGGVDFTGTTVDARTLAAVVARPCG